MILSLTLLCQMSVASSYANDEFNLSSAETSALKSLGISEEQAKNLDKAALKAKLQESLTKKINPKINEIKEKINHEKEGIKSDATKIAAGYLASTVSLFAATLIAPQVIMVCKTKPSAIIYAGSAGLYVLQEMANIKVLKASQLAEIEVVDDLKIKNELSLKENIKEVNDKVDAQVGYLKNYKKTLDDAFSALKKKAKNAKMVSVGFLASSAAAVAEQMDWFTGVAGSCVASHETDGRNHSKRALVFSSKFDDHYGQLIDKAQSAQDKWAYYYEWEAYKFGATRSMSWDEYAQLKNNPTLTPEFLGPILNSAMKMIQSQMLASAFASEKVTVAASLKNNKTADWYGDLDKLGIVGGVATNLVAYMAGWQMGFLKTIIASGTTRAITFGAQGAIAFTAGKMFDDGADGFIDRMAKIDTIIDQLDKTVKKGLDALVPSDGDAKRFQEIANKLGVPSNKLITEMSLREAGHYIEKIKDNGNEKLSDLEDKFLDSYSDKLKKKAEDFGNKIENKIETKLETSNPRSLIDWFIPSLQAAVIDPDCLDKKQCPKLIFPKSNNQNMAGFNGYLGLYEGYYSAVVNSKPQLAEVYARKLIRNKSKVAQFRNTLFLKSNAGDYLEKEKQKIGQEMHTFDQFYKKLSPSAQAEFERQLNPSKAFIKPDSSSSARSSLAESTLSGKDQSILKALLEKLDKKTSVASKVITAPENLEKESNPEDYAVEYSSIHPKESELFEIIHVRYLKFFQSEIKE